MTGVAAGHIPTASQQIATSKDIKLQEGGKPGWKTYLVQDQLFDVPERFELMHCIGRGAFGVVCSAKMVDAEGEEQRVAVKKVLIREENILEVKRLVRELYLLSHFDHENVIGLKDLIEPAHEGKWDEIYIVTELMDTDLHQIVRSQQKLTEEHIQFFLYQLLRGLKAIHAAHVLHRDLKPSNIVVNSNCDLKICDFGLAREQDVGCEMTDYVATRWYRAPELLMQWRSYSGAVDVWSVGCIFAELISRKPIFPGKNYLDQLHIILDMIGSPKDEDIEGIGSEKARNYIRQLKPKRERRDLKKIFPTVSAEAIDLLDKMLNFDPHTRITVVEALEHPYFSSMHDEEDEPDAEPFDFSFDITDTTLTVFELKDMLFQKLCCYHPEHKNWVWYTPEEKAQSAVQKEALIKKAERKKAEAAAKAAKEKADKEKAGGK